MKKSIFILSLIITLVLFGSYSYSQTHFSNSDSVINFLNGKWIWISACGGWGGDCFYPDGAGYTKSFAFTKIVNSQDSISYSYYYNDSFVQNGKLKLSYSNTRDEWSLEKVPGFMTEKVILSFYPRDSLYLVDNCDDCYFYLFVRNNLNAIDFELFDNKLIISPNPSKNLIYLDIKNHSEFEKLIIYSIEGRIIREKRNIRGSIDISDLSNGIYFIELMKGKEIYSTKFVKE
jgi:Secretion system C-terminal sorting domain